MNGDSSDTAGTMEKGEIKTSTDPAINGGSESEKDLRKKIYQSVKQETPIPIETKIIGNYLVIRCL